MDPAVKVSQFFIEVGLVLYTSHHSLQVRQMPGTAARPQVQRWTSGGMPHLRPFYTLSLASSRPLIKVIIRLRFSPAEE